MYECIVLKLLQYVRILAGSRWFFSGENRFSCYLTKHSQKLTWETQTKKWPKIEFHSHSLAIT